MRVLLVEDDHVLRSMAAEFLRDEGFEVVEAEDGHKAAQLLDGVGGFDVLLTDLEMPGTLDGVDVAARARGRNPAIAVLLVSGNVEQYLIGLDLIEPSALVFSKPFRMEQIADAMRSLAAQQSALVCSPQRLGGAGRSDCGSHSPRVGRS